MLSHDNSCNGDFPFVREEDNKKYRFFYHDPELCIHNGNPPGRIVTYRELAKWLAQGNGECYYFPDNGRWKSSCFNELRYTDDESDKVVHNVMVRKWDENEWHVPTADYLGLENNK